VRLSLRHISPILTCSRRTLLHGVPVIALQRAAPTKARGSVSELLSLDTGVGNRDGQALYRHLGNTSRDQSPVGFTGVGLYVPPPKEGATPLQLEPRVGMVAGPKAIEQIVAAAGVLLDT
jgi:hypothetical protein